MEGPKDKRNEKKATTTNEPAIALETSFLSQDKATKEIIASEQAARMLDMQNATDNANGIITELTLAYHKARQAQITQELAEIVSGASISSSQSGDHT